MAFINKLKKTPETHPLPDNSKLTTNNPIDYLLRQETKNDFNVGLHTGRVSYFDSFNSRKLYNDLAVSMFPAQKEIVTEYSRDDNNKIIQKPKQSGVLTDSEFKNNVFINDMALELLNDNDDLVNRVLENNPLQTQQDIQNAVDRIKIVLHKTIENPHPGGEIVGSLLTPETYIPLGGGVLGLIGRKLLAKSLSKGSLNSSKYYYLKHNLYRNSLKYNNIVWNKKFVLGSGIGGALYSNLYKRKENKLQGLEEGDNTTIPTVLGAGFGLATGWLLNTLLRVKPDLIPNKLDNNQSPFNPPDNTINIGDDADDIIPEDIINYDTPEVPVNNNLKSTIQELASKSGRDTFEKNFPKTGSAVVKLVADTRDEVGALIEDKASLVSINKTKRNLGMLQQSLSSFKDVLFKSYLSNKDNKKAKAVNSVLALSRKPHEAQLIKLLQKVEKEDLSKKTPYEISNITHAISTGINLIDSKSTLFTKPNTSVVMDLYVGRDMLSEITSSYFLEHASKLYNLGGAVNRAVSSLADKVVSPEYNRHLHRIFSVAEAFNDRYFLLVSDLYRIRNNLHSLLHMRSVTDTEIDNLSKDVIYMITSLRDKHILNEQVDSIRKVTPKLNRFSKQVHSKALNTREQTRQIEIDQLEITQSLQKELDNLQNPKNFVGKDKAISNYTFVKKYGGGFKKSTFNVGSIKRVIDYKIKNLSAKTKKYNTAIRNIGDLRKYLNLKPSKFISLVKNIMDIRDPKIFNRLHNNYTTLHKAGLLPSSWSSNKVALLLNGKGNTSVLFKDYYKDMYQNLQSNSDSFVGHSIPHTAEKINIHDSVSVGSNTHKNIEILLKLPDRIISKRLKNYIKKKVSLQRSSVGNDFNRLKYKLDKDDIYKFIRQFRDNNNTSLNAIISKQAPLLKSVPTREFNANKKTLISFIAKKLKQVLTTKHSTVNNNRLLKIIGVTEVENTPKQTAVYKYILESQQLTKARQVNLFNKIESIIKHIGGSDSENLKDLITHKVIIDNIFNRQIEVKRSLKSEGITLDKIRGEFKDINDASRLLRMLTNVDNKDFHLGAIPRATTDLEKLTINADNLPQVDKDLVHKLFLFSKRILNFALEPYNDPVFSSVRNIDRKDPFIRRSLENIQLQASQIKPTNAYIRRTIDKDITALNPELVKARLHKAISKSFIDAKGEKYVKQLIDSSIAILKEYRHSGKSGTIPLDVIFSYITSKDLETKLVKNAPDPDDIKTTIAELDTIIDTIENPEVVYNYYSKKIPIDYSTELDGVSFSEFLSGSFIESFRRGLLKQVNNVLLASHGIPSASHFINSFNSYISVLKQYGMKIPPEFEHRVKSLLQIYDTNYLSGEHTFNYGMASIANAYFLNKPLLPDLGDLTFLVAHNPLNFVKAFGTTIPTSLQKFLQDFNSNDWQNVPAMVNIISDNDNISESMVMDLIDVGLFPTLNKDILRALQSYAEDLDLDNVYKFMASNPEFDKKVTSKIVSNIPLVDLFQKRDLRSFSRITTKLQSVVRLLGLSTAMWKYSVNKTIILDVLNDLQTVSGFRQNKDYADFKSRDELGNLIFNINWKQDEIAVVSDNLEKHAKYKTNGTLINIGYDKWDNQMKALFAKKMLQYQGEFNQRPIDVSNSLLWKGQGRGLLTQFLDYVLNSVNHKLLRVVNNYDVSKLFMAKLAITTAITVPILGKLLVWQRTYDDEDLKEKNTPANIVYTGLKYTYVAGYSSILETLHRMFTQYGGSNPPYSSAVGVASQDIAELGRIAYDVSTDEKELNREIETILKTIPFFGDSTIPNAFTTLIPNMIKTTNMDKKETTQPKNNAIINLKHLLKDNNVRN